MAAVELEWIPETLYNTAISAVVDNYIRSRRDIRSLPENIQFDVYYKVRPICSIGPCCGSRAAPPSTSTSRPVALQSGSAEVAAFRYPTTLHPRVCLRICVARGFLCECYWPSPSGPHGRPEGNAWPGPVPPGPLVAGVFSTLSSLGLASAGLFLLRLTLNSPYFVISAVLFTRVTAFFFFFSFPSLFGVPSFFLSLNPK